MKRVHRFMAGLGAAAAFAAMGASAEATNASHFFVGPPIATHSWSQVMFEYGSPFDSLQAHVTQGAGFKTGAGETGIGYFTDASWAQVANDGTDLVAKGNSVADLGFWWHFAGTSADPLAFDMQTYNGDTRVDNVHAAWDGAKWSFSASQWEQNAPLPGAPVAPVPEPSFLQMGSLLGLGTFGFLRIGRRRA